MDDINFYDKQRFYPVVEKLIDIDLDIDQNNQLVHYNPLNLKKKSFVKYKIYTIHPLLVIN